MMQISIKAFTGKEAKQVSELIHENIWKVNIKDYSKTELQQVANDFAPGKLIEKSASREMYVGWKGNEIVGTAGFHKNPFDVNIPSHYVLGVFVKVRYHRNGIGRKLIEHVEAETKKRGIRMLIVPASITSRLFYMNLDYMPQGDMNGFNAKNGTYTLVKMI